MSIHHTQTDVNALDNFKGQGGGGGRDSLFSLLYSFFFFFILVNKFLLNRENIYVTA